MAVTKRLRFEILRRDGFQCRYCRITPLAEQTGYRGAQHVAREAS